MRVIILLVLYSAMSFVANIAFAQEQGLEQFQVGELKAFNVHSTPRPVSPQMFFDESGQEISLEMYKGQVVLLNFWATWCAPCRHEMPHLAALQAQLGGDDFQVVTVATGPNPKAAIANFFRETQIDNLPQYTDPRQSFARGMRVLGLPVSILIDKEGFEVGRLQGEADWSGEAAVALVSFLAAL